MRNTALSETELIDAALAVLRKETPDSWLVSRLSSRRDTKRDPAAIFAIEAPDGARATLLVGATMRVDARDVAALARRLRSQQTAVRADSMLVVAPFLGERARELLRSESIAYMDSTGNVRLQVHRPALLIRTTGSTSSPWKEENQGLRSLRGPSSGRALRALVDFRPPFGVRELADRAGTPAATLSRVADFLAREALLERAGDRGKIVAVDWTGAIRRWVHDYSFAGSNRVAAYLAPRGLTALQRELVDSALRYAITGSFAAHELNPIAEPRLATVFVAELGAAARSLDLRPADAGANVILAEPYDRVVFERTRSIGGSTYASPSQVAADSLTGPGRGPSEGQAVLDWMAQHEDAWRV